MVGGSEAAVSQVLRLCVSVDSLPLADCVVPDRCQLATCSGCGRSVHYDPKASIPLLGEEVILCETCTDQLLDYRERMGL